MVVTDIHKKFIKTQIQNLADYDSLRPLGHVYEFHLHSQRVANSMKALAIKMGYDASMADALYWATLPHDIGKTSLPGSIWDLDDKPTDDERHERRSHTWRGVEIVRADFGDTCDHDPFLKMMIDIMNNHHENCDGSGYLGKTTKDLSTEVLMACICDAFDGYSVHRPHFQNRDISSKAVIQRMTIEKAGQFDNQILKSFEEILPCQSRPYSSPQ
jgi:HD-GYP domain-containing protein (c-di-GMP phosphodiesterase class II)